MSHHPEIDSFPLFGKHTVGQLVVYLKCRDSAILVISPNFANIVNDMMDAQDEK